MKIQLLVRSYGRMIGLARYTASLCQALTEAGVVYSLATPAYPLLVKTAHKSLTPFGFDVHTFFTTYPLTAPFSRDTLKHLTAQQMTTLLWFNPRLHPVVVTVHDIVPFLVRRDKDQSVFRHPLELIFDRMAVLALKWAEALISDSQFTKNTIVEALGYSTEKIFVVPLGVDHEIFRPLSVPEEFRNRYQLDSRLHYILYIGSENPRKNLPRLISAFAKIKAALPEVRLIKIGSPEHLAQAEQLRLQIEQMGLTDAVLFYEHVSDQDLAIFYNLAELFVFPSLYEGFGLPPLEAMACGTPVVCSNAASLPEVVGDAAIMVDPYDVEGLAEAMRQVLMDAELREELRRRGLKQARQFTWERTARETLAVYQEIF